MYDEWKMSQTQGVHQFWQCQSKTCMY